MRTLAFFSLLAATPTLAQTPCDTPAAGAVVLTIAGTASNRGAVDPAHDKFLGYHDIAFEEACALSRDDLLSLGDVEVGMTLPDEDRLTVFTGPLLGDVLDAAGLGAEGVNAMALDGYAATIPRALIDDKRAILALSRDGAPLGIGGYGPAMVVFPDDDGPSLGRYQVWSVFYMSGE